MNAGPIVIFGESLGAAVAVAEAVERPPVHGTYRGYDVYAMARRLLGHLPQNNTTTAPRVASDDPADRCDEALDEVIPESPSQPYDMHEVIDRIVDEIDTAHYPNGSAESITYDAQRHLVVDAEPNIVQHLRWRAFDVETSAGRIVAGGGPDRAAGYCGCSHSDDVVESRSVCGSTGTVGAGGSHR